MKRKRRGCSVKSQEYVKDEGHIENTRRTRLAREERSRCAPKARVHSDLRRMLTEYSKNTSYMLWCLGVICNHFFVWCFPSDERPHLDPRYALWHAILVMFSDGISDVGGPGEPGGVPTRSTQSASKKHFVTRSANGRKTSCLCIYGKEEDVARSGTDHPFCKHWELVSGQRQMMHKDKLGVRNIRRSESGRWTFE